MANLFAFASLYSIIFVPFPGKSSEILSIVTLSGTSLVATVFISSFTHAYSLFNLTLACFEVESVSYFEYLKYENLARGMNRSAIRLSANIFLACFWSTFLGLAF